MEKQNVSLSERIRDSPTGISFCNRLISRYKITAEKELEELKAASDYIRIIGDRTGASGKQKRAELKYFIRLCKIYGEDYLKVAKEVNSVNYGKIGKFARRQLNFEWAYVGVLRHKHTTGNLPDMLTLRRRCRELFAPVEVDSDPYLRKRHTSGWTKKPWLKSYEREDLQEGNWHDSGW